MRLLCTAAVRRPTFKGFKLVNLQVVLFEGSLGMTLGRCDRTELNWQPGPWDKEPDVITWEYEGLHIVASRQQDGRWQTAFLSREDSPPRSVKAKDIADMTGIALDRLGTGIVNLDDLGLAKHFNCNYNELWQKPLVVAADVGGCPCYGDVDGYRSAQDVVEEAALVLKALLLDDQLRNGTDLAWAFDNAARMSSPDIDTRRLSVKHILASEKINGSTSTMMQTWSGQFILHTYLEPDANFILRVEDPEAFVDQLRPGQPLCEEFCTKVKQWLFVQGLGKVGTAEQIDQVFTRELAELDKVLA